MKIFCVYKNKIKWNIQHDIGFTVTIPIIYWEWMEPNTTVNGCKL